MNITNKEQLELLKQIKPYADKIAQYFLSKFYIIGYNVFFVIEDRGIVGQGYWYTKSTFELTSQNDLKNVLYNNFLYILLSFSAKIDNGKVSAIYNEELYNLLLKAKKGNEKLNQLLEYLFKKLILIIKAVLNEENKVISNGMLNYNPNSMGKKLINTIIKRYKEEVNNKYQVYKNYFN